MSTIMPTMISVPGGENLPTDLPLVNTAEAEEGNSGVSAALIGGIVGVVIGLGLLTLLAVALAKYFGVPCICAGAGAGAAGAGAGTGPSDGVYETPIVVPVNKKKGFFDVGKGPGYTDLAFDNNAYSRGVELIAGVLPEPPAYSEADPVESPYSDIAPPMYNNLNSVTAQTPSAPAEYDNRTGAANKGAEYDNLADAVNKDADKKGESYDNKTYDNGPSAGDIINAKNALKSTGADLA